MRYYNIPHTIFLGHLGLLSTHGLAVPEEGVLWESLCQGVCSLFLGTDGKDLDLSLSTRALGSDGNTHLCVWCVVEALVSVPIPRLLSCPQIPCNRHVEMCI